MKKGLWTICLHPNALGEERLQSLEAFLSARPGAFPDPREAAKAAVPFGSTDALFAAAFGLVLKARKAAGRLKRNVE